MTHDEIIQKFYAAFAELDPARMSHCYAEEVVFNDAVFSLRGRREVMAMWTMLCDSVRANGRDVWRLELVEHGASGNRGTARWEPYYRFSATGRLVHNVIRATFEFRDGLIVRHDDSFDFYRWSRQAFGPVGWALGWTPLLRSKVRAQAAKNLAKYLDRL
jgi:limonene-1,2-epoxide hydrolase